MARRRRKSLSGTSSEHTSRAIMLTDLAKRMSREATAAVNAGECPKAFDDLVKAAGYAVSAKEHLAETNAWRSGGTDGKYVQQVVEEARNVTEDAKEAFKFSCLVGGFAGLSKRRGVR